MNAKTMMLGGLAIGGAVIAMFFLKKQSTQSKGPNQQIDKKPNNMLSGSNRMDNASQPWYVGVVKGAVSTEAAKFKASPTKELANIGSVIHSVGDVWGQVSGYFSSTSSSGTDFSTAGTPDDLPPYDDLLLPGSGQDQSNSIGDQLSIPTSDYPPVQSMDMSFDNPASGAGMIASDNSDFSAIDSSSMNNFNM